MDFAQKSCSINFNIALLIIWLGASNSTATFCNMPVIINLVVFKYGMRIKLRDFVLIVIRNFIMGFLFGTSEWPDVIFRI